MDNDLYLKAKKEVFNKLENSLSGTAFLLKDDYTTSPEEKQAKMQVVEQLTLYLRNYDRNIQLLAEYEDFKERMIDDGR